MILIDFSQVFLAATFSFSEDFKKGNDTNKMKDILRHVLFTSLLQYKKTFRKYGEMVLCLDGRKVWRKEIFPQYKAGRSTARAESDLDWKTIFEFLEEAKLDLETIFPWKVLFHENMEGDDVIAAMVKYTQENELSSGMFDEPQPVMIVSSDGDLKQLHKYKNVKQFSPMQKKNVTGYTKDFLVDKIIRGDGGDGVPSILSPDDFFTREERTRATPITKKVIERVLKGQLSEEELKNYERNRVMVDLDCVPEHLSAAIISQYQQEKTCNLKEIFNYLMEKRCRVLIDRIQEFK